MYFIVLTFIGLASLLVWYFLRHDHGRKLTAETLWLAFGFGILALVLAMVVEQFVFPKVNDLAGYGPMFGYLFIYFLGIGLVEEAAKFTPLAFFIYRKPYFREHTNGIIYFAICGLTFGLCENILYTLSYGSSAGIARLLLTPFFHAATTSILGYYLVGLKIERQRYWLKFILACLLLPFLHGLYDFGLFSQNMYFIIVSLMVTLLLTMGLFLYFMQANDLDKSRLAATVTPNKFCTRCGKPNLGSTRYCEYCGNQL